MKQPLRVLFVCTGNSARSQLAKALLALKGRGRFIAASVGSEPKTRVDPLAVRVLAEHGIDWSRSEPKGFDAVLGSPWDLAITLCDRARERCPRFLENLGPDGTSAPTD